MGKLRVLSGDEVCVIFGQKPTAAACPAPQVSTIRSEPRSGATNGCFESPVNSKNTGDRSPSPDGDERVCCSGTGYDAGVSLVS